MALTSPSTSQVPSPSTASKRPKTPEATEKREYISCAPLLTASFRYSQEKLRAPQKARESVILADQPEEKPPAQPKETKVVSPRAGTPESRLTLSL